MTKTWDVTIMKVGSILVEAETEVEAKKRAESLAETPINIDWEDSWNVVDASLEDDFDE